MCVTTVCRPLGVPCREKTQLNPALSLPCVLLSTFPLFFSFLGRGLMSFCSDSVRAGFAIVYRGYPPCYQPRYWMSYAGARPLHASSVVPSVGVPPQTSPPWPRGMQGAPR